MQDMQNTDWNEYATSYDSLLALAPYRAMLCDVADAIHASGVQKVLDAGCGTGNLTALLKKSGTDIVGIDSSREMLARATSKCPCGTFIPADMNATLPFVDGSFGAIACVNALYAVANPAHTLAEFARTLATNGTLVVATPKRGYENGLILKAHCKSEKPDSYWQNAHASPEREEMLVREALQDDIFAERMLAVAAINRRIAKTAQFHFFTEKELREAIESAGLVTTGCQETYARQSHLIAAQKP